MQGNLILGGQGNLTAKKEEELVMIGGEIYSNRNKFRLLLSSLRPAFCDKSKEKGLTALLLANLR
jgi:hypothetical protein